MLLAALAAAEPLTPEAVTRLALEQNPQLAAARAAIAEAEARASGLGRLPNPELETEFAAGSRERGRLEVGLSQTFPRASRLRMERRVASEAIGLARLEVSAAEAETLARARAALVNLAAAQETLAVTRRQADLARAFANSQRRQVSEGQSSALDAAQADLTAREAELATAEPKAALAEAVAALATILGQPADAALSASFDLALPIVPASEAAFGSRPDLALAEAALTAGDADVALARTQGREDWRAGVFVEAEQDRDDLGDRERTAMLGLRFSVPLPVRNVSAPAVAEKQAARRRLALERDALALAARNEFTATAAALKAKHASARAVADELLPAARAHLAATESAYARGEAEITQVFRARERLAEFERADLAARHAYHLAVVQHQAATGRLLP